MAARGGAGIVSDWRHVTSGEVEPLHHPEYAELLADEEAYWGETSGNGTEAPVEPAAGKPRKLNLRWVSEVVAEPPPEPPELVTGFLRKGELAVVGSLRAIGKTQLGFNLAALLGRGEGLFCGNGDLRVVQRARVLYAQGEMDPWGSWRRWALLTGTHGPPLGVAETFDRWSIKVIERRASSSGKDQASSWTESESFVDAVLDRRLEETVVEEGFDVLIIDPWAVFYGGKENSNDEVQEAVDQLRHLSLATGLAVVILHHVGKATEQREPEDMWRGASRLADWASTRWTLLPHYTEKQAKDQGMTRHQARRYVDVKVLRRHEPVDDFSMVLNWETGWWERWASPSELAAGRRVEIAPIEVAKILEESGGEWRSVRDAEAALGLSHDPAKRALDRAVTEGWIEPFEGARRAVGYRLKPAEEEF